MACSEADFEYLRAVVLSQSANRIAPSRASQMEARLRPLAKRAGASTLEGLVTMLRVDPEAHLHRAVAEAMTINETSFFRDASVFNALRDVILPRLIAQNAAERRLRIWSAACSTGQEAYSVAILLREHFPQLAGWDVRILGTDLSRHVIDYARVARYRRLEVNRGLPARLLLKYLSRNGDEWEIAPSVRALCDFEPLNLRDPLPPLPRFNLVLLRNVLLYFPPQDRGPVFAAVHARMAPRAHLLLGAAEQAEDSTNLFRAEFTQDCYFYTPIQ